MSFRGDEEHGDGNFVTRINGGRSHPHKRFIINPHRQFANNPTNDIQTIPTDDPLTNHIIPHDYLRNRIRA